MTSLSRKGIYALRALYALAGNGSREPVLISELASREHIPRKFLELILRNLKNAGILRSKKGKGGGYMLARHPADLRLGDVIRAIDGPLVGLRCVGEDAPRCDDCEDRAACGARMLVKQVGDAVARIVDGTTLAGVLEQCGRAGRSPSTLSTQSV